MYFLERKFVSVPVAFCRLSISSRLHELFDMLMHFVIDLSAVDKRMAALVDDKYKMFEARRNKAVSLHHI